jgi:hypothetical protein
LPGMAMHAQVASISPEVSVRTFPAASESGDKNVVVVILDMDRGGSVLPIGTPVTVRFDACPPPKT